MFVAADDMIPATLHVVCQAQLDQAYSHFHYIELFQEPNERFG